MDFDAFLALVPKIILEKLPDAVSHQKMAPLERMEIMKNLDLEKANPRKAAVMMLCYPKNKKTHLVLILRNTYPGVHSSQIAFPGGKVEDFDENLEQTALRETHEEVGILPSQITVIRAFSDVYIPPSNFLVFPYMGYSTATLQFIPDPAEVAGIIELPLENFLDDGIVVLNKMATSYNSSIDVPAFNIDGQIVWGATAMMMSELKDVLKKVIGDG
ncbi:MAG: CoA pyrophosphatase [Flavobacterium sp.]|nr:CoA pyrophosphatase [Flavobacterium sp.]